MPEGSWVMSSPSNEMRPELARGLPHTVISSEVLPAPLEPISEHYGAICAVDSVRPMTSSQCRALSIFSSSLRR